MKAKIYRIVLPCGGTYVGKTTNHEYQRWGQHLNELSRGKHYNKQMQKSYDNGEVDDWKFEVIESIESDDKSYISLMEQHHISIEENSINSHGVYGNSQERRESYRGRYKEYYRENKDEILAKSNAYYQENKDEIKAKQNVYYQKNKDKILKYQREYQKQKNKV